MDRNGKRIWRGNHASLRMATTPRQAPSEFPRPLVIFDTSYLAHRARWANNGMEYKGQPTGVLYGTILQINRIRRLFPANAMLVFAWDSMFSKRREIYPEYKAQRKQKPVTEAEKKEKEAFFKQMALLRSEVLEPLGFANHIKCEGYEADDCIACAVVAGNKHPEIGKIWIVSSDDDLFQLLNYATLYRPHKERNYGKEDLWREFGVEPEEWVTATAIAGTHNGVAGVFGVGLKTAIAYLQGKPISPKKEQAIKAAETDNMINRNLHLIQLPFGNAFDIFESKKGFPTIERFRLNMDGLAQVKERFGFSSLRAEELA